MKFEEMKLQEKHKEFVVRHFARFRKLTNIVDEFMEEFEDDLPPLEVEEKPDLDEFVAELSQDEEFYKPAEFIEKFTNENKEEFKEKYGDKADQKLNEKALEEFEFDFRMQCITIIDEVYGVRESDRIDHKKEIRENLFNRFRRLNINHPQFPSKYLALFTKTRDEYCENYRIQDLNTPESLARELETLYGYQKQLIFQLDDPKDIMKHLNSAHQILKTILAHNALNANQQLVDITPQNIKALEDTQKVLTEHLKQVTHQLKNNTSTSNGDDNT